MSSDVTALDVTALGICQAERKGKNPRFPIRCTLVENHTGPHIAYGIGGVVVKRWANPEKTDMRRGNRG